MLLRQNNSRRFIKLVQTLFFKKILPEFYYIVLFTLSFIIILFYKIGQLWFSRLSLIIILSTMLVEIRLKNLLVISSFLYTMYPHCFQSMNKTYYSLTLKSFFIMRLAHICHSLLFSIVIISKRICMLVIVVSYWMDKRILFRKYAINILWQHNVCVLKMLLNQQYLSLLATLIALLLVGLFLLLLAADECI